MAVHEGLRVTHRAHVVMMTQRAVAGETGGGGFPAPVHGDEIDVDVDDEVALRGPLVDLDLLTLLGGADEQEVVGILGIVVEQQALRCECVVDTIAHGMAQFRLRHSTVQRERSDKLHVVDSGGGREFEHRFDDALTDVGSLHRGQRKGDVVECDGELHPRLEQRSERFAVTNGIHQRMADGGVGVLQWLDGFGRIDDAAASGREPFETEALAMVEQDRGSRAIDVEYEPRSRHGHVPFRCGDRRQCAPHRGHPRWRHG